MKLLLDTHALLWWWTDDARLSPASRAAIATDANAVFVSAASAWEIATKHRLGKLGGATEAVERYAALVDADGFAHFPVSARHGLRAGTYPAEHRDPFDRMLAAQSELEDLTLVTRDPAFGAFGTRTLW